MTEVNINNNPCKQVLKACRQERDLVRAREATGIDFLNMVAACIVPCEADLIDRSQRALSLYNERNRTLNTYKTCLVNMKKMAENYRRTSKPAIEQKFQNTMAQINANYESESAAAQALAPSAKSGSGGALAIIVTIVIILIYLQVVGFIIRAFTSLVFDTATGGSLAVGGFIWLIFAAAGVFAALKFVYPKFKKSMTQNDEKERQAKMAQAQAALNAAWQRKGQLEQNAIATRKNEIAQMEVRLKADAASCAQYEETVNGIEARLAEINPLIDECEKLKPRIIATMEKECQASKANFSTAIKEAYAASLA